MEEKPQAGVGGSSTTNPECEVGLGQREQPPPEPGPSSTRSQLSEHPKTSGK